MTINVARLAYSTRPELTPARRWAEKSGGGRLDNRQVTLDAATLAILAEPCGLSAAELRDALREVNTDHSRPAVQP